MHHDINVAVSIREGVVTLCCKNDAIIQNDCEKYDKKLPVHCRKHHQNGVKDHGKL